MLVVGLTGGIGMGKSTVAKILRRQGYPVYSADKAVHDVLKKGGRAVSAVARVFPGTLKRGAIDRQALACAVFGKPDALRKLENIVHPLLRKSEREFLKNARHSGARAAILEIPLLFETGAEKRCNLTLCVFAPRAVQRDRVLARPGMTPQKLKAIRARQMPDAEKRRRADYIIPTDVSPRETSTHLRALFAELLGGA